MRIDRHDFSSIIIRIKYGYHIPGLSENWEDMFSCMNFPICTEQTHLVETK